jgi:dimeric dUTPase (all-alpha-NTP-PPase superfamily)
MVETKIFEIMDEAKELEEKIEKYKDVADQEMVIVWMDNMLKLLMKLGKLAEETEDRLDELKESVEK